MNALKARFQIIKQHLTAFWQTIRPGPRAWKGAGWGVFILAAALLLGMGLYNGLASKGWWIPITTLSITLVGLIFLTLSILLINLLTLLLGKLPKFYREVSLGAAVVLAFFFLMTVSGIGGKALLVSAILITGSLLGAGIAALSHRGTRLRRSIAIGGLILGIVLLSAGTAAYLWSGPALPPALDTAADGKTSLAAPGQGNPAQPGSYSVQTLTYGSGTDNWRPEFGAEAAIRTQSVDGSALVGNWTGFSGWMRTQYWGFEADALPINGRVWYPEGSGPFPLILMVHGNHYMMDDSDPGYAYLGEVFASRGFIAVSVDENFLNGTWSDLPLPGMGGSLEEENDLRGWLLLQHLRQWERMNTTAGGPFLGKVDMNQIGLLGHSRGGEAVAIAAAFNRLPAHPDNALIPFDFNYNIRAVAAIAPVDQQYTPSDRGTPLEDVNYFLIQGAYDGDVSPMMGIRQYNRLTFSPNSDFFKAAWYVDRANHGQFNTTWGRSDSGSFPGDGLLSLASLLPAEKQQQIATVALSAFFEAALHGQDEYRAVFRDPRAAADWLPDTAIFNRYEDSQTLWLTTYQEDINIQTGTLSGTAMRGENLTLWRENLVKLKYGDQGTQVAVLGWDTPALPGAAYTLSLPELDYLNGKEILTFAAASLSIDPNPGNMGTPGESDESISSEPHAVDLSIEVMDVSGNIARLPISQWKAIPPMVTYVPVKMRLLSSTDNVFDEPFLQTWEFPLSSFKDANPAFDPTHLTQIRLVFDQTPAGVIVLDQIGLRR